MWKRIFLGFEEGSEYFRYPEKHVATGNPVRKSFYGMDREQARKDLGFRKKDFVLLAFGGSQGAGRINQAMISVIRGVPAHRRQMKICLATGRYYYDAVCSELTEKKIDIIFQYQSDGIYQ